MQVHDEFVYEIQDTHIEQMILNMKNILESDNLLTDYISNGLQVTRLIHVVLMTVIVIVVYRFH